ncbi:MAG: cobaltochelatase subunit CobN [Methanophagales archaeon]|nr:cobaltochelatase subunit CobN [Methanophagales archaeon]
MRRDGSIERHKTLKERVRRAANRVKSWIELREKPINERRVAFILYNNPCASVEATMEQTLMPWRVSHEI